MGDSLHFGKSGKRRDKDGKPLPKAEITPDGDFLIEGVAVGIDPAQRRELLAYRGQVIDIAKAGIDIGERSAQAALDMVDRGLFSLMVGVACAALGEKGAPIVKAMDSLGHVMLKVTSMVMNVAPIAVFAAMAAVISQKGIGILYTYGKFIGQFYLGLLLLWAVLLLVCWAIIGRRTGTLISRIKDPLLLAFSTASSTTNAVTTLDTGGATISPPGCAALTMLTTV